MLKAVLGTTKEPFCTAYPVLLPQQQEIANMLLIHANAGGGLSVIIGNPGVARVFCVSTSNNWARIVTLSWLPAHARCTPT